MDALTCWIVVYVAGATVPADRDRFPADYVATEQVGRCRAHEQRLLHLGHLRGWEGGVWERAVEETRNRRLYWETLGSCERWGFGVGDVWLLSRLGALRRLIGEKHWRGGWSPPPLPADDTYPPLLPTPSHVPGVPDGNANGC